jgi:hypothetical protein
MSEIPSDWSPDALLLFVGAFTAFSAGASIFLAEISSQKMRRRKEHFKIWQDRRLEIWQEHQRESFLRFERTAKKARSEVNQRSDDNEDVDAGAIGIAFASGGACKAVKTTPLLTVEEAVEAMKKAAGSEYRAPH